MTKEVESILLLNWYYIKCYTEDKKCKKTKLTKKYLFDKIKNLLFKK